MVTGNCISEGGQEDLSKEVSPGKGLTLFTYDSHLNITANLECSKFINSLSGLFLYSFGNPCV